MTRMLHVPNKSIQFHYWNPDYLNLVEFQSMYWEMETVFFRAVSCQLYNTPEYHLYIHSLGVQHVLHHPELYIESNYEYSWQNYVNNMARQGTWADNIIIQAVANSLNITINIIESNANFPPVTVINPVNTDRQIDKYLY